MSWLALGYYCWLGRPPTLRGEKQSEQWNNSPEEISNPVKNWRNILNKISCNLSVDFVFLSGLTYFIISNQQSYLFSWIVYSNTLLTKIYQSLIWWMLITKTMSPSGECGRECLIEQQITMIQLPCDGCKMTCSARSCLGGGGGHLPQSVVRQGWPESLRSVRPHHSGHVRHDTLVTTHTHIGKIKDSILFSIK